MDRRHLPLTALRSFETVGRCLSFARAAEVLGVTHGAVSRQITALEQLLGVRLFERGARLAFTDEGERLFAGVRPAFDRLAEAMEEVKRDDSRSVLAVNAPPTFTMKWLIPRLSSFHRRHRDIEVRLSTGIGPPGELKTNEVDVIIRRLAPSESNGRSTPFLASALLAVCAPELIERHPIHVPEDLLDLPFIEAATSNVSWADWLDRAGCELTAKPKFTRFEQMFYALEAALDGLGVALLPSALILDDLAARRLVLAWHVTGMHERDYCHVLSPQTHSGGLASTFVAWLSQEGEDSNRFGQAVIGACLQEVTAPPRTESAPSRQPRSSGRNASPAPPGGGPRDLPRATRSNRHASR
jgi:LysR family transcriptional regulator, glycine cleavage system transcriptional activator